LNFPPAGRFKAYAVPGLLFLITLLFTLVIGVQYHISYHDVILPAGAGFWGFLWKHPASWLWGLSYSLPLLGILLVHEMGHFFACRRHGPHPDRHLRRLHQDPLALLLEAGAVRRRTGRAAGRFPGRPAGRGRGNFPLAYR
jgi:hypothetical protein